MPGFPHDSRIGRHGRLLVAGLVVAFVSCADEPRECPELFGRPNENTGLPGAACGPHCPCAHPSLDPTVLPQAELDRLDALEWRDPPDLLATDPYNWDPAPTVDLGMNCGIAAVPESPGAYRAISFSKGAAAHGAILTHTGACGHCSSLRDLSVYMRYGDLTSPVRTCAARDLSGGKDEVLDCLRELGFSEPCALIWYYNATNTRTHCLVPCLEALEEPYHLPDGSLNECLLCDEEQSGPVFKAVAGRTRRNSGLPTAICRPCSGIPSITHDYSTIP